MAFTYGGDIGVDSIGGIEAAENASGIPHVVSSTYRPNARTLTGNVSYHARRNAVDSYSSPMNMQSMATWIIKNYGPFTLELIHSGGPGFFVHNGKVVGAGFYGAAIVDQHYGHVHWAITNSGLKAGGGGVTAMNAVSGQQGGMPCAMVVLGAMAGVAGIVEVVAHLV